MLRRSSCWIVLFSCVLAFPAITRLATAGEDQDAPGSAPYVPDALLGWKEVRSALEGHAVTVAGVDLQEMSLGVRLRASTQARLDAAAAALKESPYFGLRARDIEEPLRTGSVVQEGDVFRVEVWLVAGEAGPEDALAPLPARDVPHEAVHAALEASGLEARYMSGRHFREFPGLGAVRIHREFGVLDPASESNTRLPAAQLRTLLERLAGLDRARVLTLAWEAVPGREDLVQGVKLSVAGWRPLADD
ncbi:MAG: hypothetical protein ACYTG6_03350 [Planctomycetota bacterium]|jgi:hypothetical protein